MKKLLNEKTLLKETLNMKGFMTDKKPYNRISVLIKHYLSEGMNVVQVRAAIDKFMESHQKHYVALKWKANIDRWVKKIADKNDYTLNEIEEVKITQYEMDTISQLNDEKMKKILFVALIHSKIYNQLKEKNDNWVNSTTNEIFSDAKLSSVKMIRKELIIGELIDEGLLTQANKNKNVKIIFNENDKSKVVITVRNFTDFLYEYHKWNGAREGKCEICNDPYLIMSIKNTNSKYCDTHRESQRHEKQKEWDQKNKK